METETLLDNLDTMYQKIEELENIELIIDYKEILKEKEKLTKEVKKKINDWEDITKSKILKFVVKKQYAYNIPALKMLLWNKYPNYVSIIEKPLMKEIKNDFKDTEIIDDIENSLEEIGHKIYIEKIEQEIKEFNI